MIAATTIVVVLAFVSLVCGFKHALVVVLEDNEFLPALAARGVTKELHFGSRTDSVVSSLRKSHLTWRFYIQDSNMPCSLDSSLQEKFNFLISPEDKVGKSECAHLSDTDGTIALYAFEPPAFGFYFPENGADPDWLRRFVDLTLFSPLFEDTLIVILSQVSYTDSTASLLFLGKGVQQHTESLDATLLTNMMTHFGFAVIDPPTTFRGNSNHLSFEKIFIVVLENQPLKVTIKDKHFRKFVSRGTLLTNYNALINPSQPNYFAMTAGDTRGCTGDDPIDVTGRFVVDLFEEHNITWKAYMEAYPGNCFTGGKFGRYRRKHNPFISFPQVRNNPELCSKVVHSDQLKIDVEANELPQYSFYTPDMDNDGHDTGIAYAGRWLNRFLSPLLNSQSFMKGTLVVVTFDEGIKPDNKIYTLLLGDMIPSGHLDNTNYTHYSLLRMVEDQFSLPTLGRFDANASHINASNFYPGKIPMPSNWPYIIGGTSLGVGVLATIGAAVYYKQVVRKRKFGPKVACEESKEGESQMFLRSVGVSEWQTPGNDTDSGGSDNSV